VYGLTLVAAPAEEPLTTAELKAWLRQDHSADDALIAGLGVGARALVEKLSGRQLVTATWKLTLDRFPYPGGWEFLEAPSLFPDPHTIRMPKAPLASVTWVKYYDLGSNFLTLDASVYDVSAATDPGRIFLAMNKVWPVTRLRPEAVQVQFVAGYGDAGDVPEEVKIAIKMTVAHWYENRGEADMTDLPMGAKSLLNLIWNGELEYGT